MYGKSVNVQTSHLWRVIMDNYITELLTTIIGGSLLTVVPILVYAILYIIFGMKVLYKLGIEQYIIWLPMVHTYEIGIVCRKNKSTYGKLILCPVFMLIAEFLSSIIMSVTTTTSSIVAGIASVVLGGVAVVVIYVYFNYKYWSRIGATMGANPVVSGLLGTFITPVLFIMLSGNNYQYIDPSNDNYC